MGAFSRRDTLLAGVATAAAACTETGPNAPRAEAPMTHDPILATHPLGFPWTTPDPFLFCVHHDDAYPKGNAQMAPDPALLRGREFGQDFEGRDGWRMYHGTLVPGFPQHPHRGFETVTIVRRGLCDHSDSLGAAARFGGGDVQWLTAGRGIRHSEMFPLLKQDATNPLELFQIWLNLPRAEKLVEPHFTMLWDHAIPRIEAPGVLVRTIAGALEGQQAPRPPPHSWASKPEAQVAIWTLKLEPGARFTLPPAPGTNRALYFFIGDRLTVGARTFTSHARIDLKPDLAATLAAGEGPVEALLLQGKPIREPVVQYGPFVMTSREEIQQTFAEYQRTGFGGWPWPSEGPVHAREEGRFARHADGRIERPA